MANLPTMRSRLTERPSAVRVVPLTDLRRLHRMALIILLMQCLQAVLMLVLLGR